MNYDAINQNVCSCLLWWKKTDDYLLLISFLYQNSGLVLIFPNFTWKLLENWEKCLIVQLRDCKLLKNYKWYISFSQNLWNRTIIKLIQFCLCSLYSFCVVKTFSSSEQRWRLLPPGFNRVNILTTLAHLPKSPPKSFYKKNFSKNFITNKGFQNMCTPGNLHLSYVLMSPIY